MRTTPYLTKFEIARLIGVRTLQICDQNVQIDSDQTALQRAIQELLEGACPIVIRRYLPDGTHEDVKVSDLKIPQRARYLQLNPEF